MRKNSTNSPIRSRAAVLTAGLVASLAMGAAGTAFAGGAAQGAGGGILARGTAAKLAKATSAQAEVQQHEAQAAQVREVRADRHERAMPWVKPVAAKYVLTAGFDQSGGMW